MEPSNVKTPWAPSLRDALFALAVLAILVSAVPVSLMAGVPDISGAVGVTMIWLMMGTAVFFAMKKIGAFRK